MSRENVIVDKLHFDADLNKKDKTQQSFDIF